MITLRASQLGLTRRCPPSQDQTGLRVSGDDQPAAMGRALHHLILTAIGHGQHLEVSDVAAMYLVDSEELERLAAQTWRAWEQVKEYFPNPAVEEYMEWVDVENNVTLAGHGDAISVALDMDPELAFADLKSGYGYEDHSDQMKAYAWLLLHKHPEYDSACGMVISPRFGAGNEAPNRTGRKRHLGQTYHRKDLALWWQGIVQRIKENENVYSTGPHCMNCPRAATCDALTARLHQIRRVLTFEGRPVGGVIRTLREVYQDVKMMEKACAVALTVIKAEVAANGNPELALVEEERETIRVQSAAALNTILEYADGWAGMKGILKASKTEFKKAVMADSPHGQKGNRAEAAVERLREMGAVEKSIVTKLEIRKCRESETHSALSLPSQKTE
jgi:hypothetical protein